MSGHGNCSGLDKDGNGDCRYDDIRCNSGNSHAEDDAHDHDHQAAEIQLALANNLEDDVSEVQTQPCQGHRSYDHPDDCTAHPHRYG